MRPIDADALIRAIKNDIDLLPHERIYCIKNAREAPTLDYKDLVPHGEWLNINGSIHCSVCHMERDSYCHEKYCPECGAKMAEEERKCEIHPWWNE